MDIDRSQMMRGTLEGCILKIIESGETYGYEIVSQLLVYGFEDSKEGTIYPLLLRLEKKDFIKSVLKESPVGPKRKYYHLTPNGQVALNQFTDLWSKVKNSVDAVLQMERV